MSNYRLISKNKFGGVAITDVSDRWLKENKYDYAKLAAKYNLREPKLINVKEIPSNVEYRLAWRYPDFEADVEVLRGVVRERYYYIRSLHKKRGKVFQMSPEALESHNLDDLKNLWIQLGNI